MPLVDRIIVQALPHAELHHWRPLQVGQIVCDSRRVAPGDLFVAVPGVSVDGHRYVPDALRAGAVACVVERMLPELEGVPVAVVPDAREALAHLHAALNDYPARHLRVIGVTGTDGKTTTVRLISSILQAAGHRVGSIDTVATTIDRRQRPTGLHTSTPDAPEVQHYLAEMVRAGMEYAVIEATSHGLAQHRVSACEFDVAVITNLTHEHLDYHGSFEAYREAKAMLFRSLEYAARKGETPKIAVLNSDDEASYEYLSPIPADERIIYGLRAPAMFTAQDIRVSQNGLSFTARLPEGPLPIVSKLMGRHNVYNILAALAVAHAMGVDPETARRGVETMEVVLGRMDRVDRDQPFTVLVDFAHTPNALASVLRAGRELARGRVIVVFGCPGLRDRGKRGLMGEAAGRLADRVIVTTDDPRTEPLSDIMDEIEAGYRRTGRATEGELWRIPDRSEAIAAALKMAGPGDVVILAGKGHERTIAYERGEYPWSDYAVAAGILRDLGYQQGDDLVY
ncbi:MAG: UDP-N-acetylmuramoyl-L-alanyl-D-glutamate--2,6-diaminopimelate ligase [Anaerolineae bacterium]|jgi:UDP-N-acetylmuramoyl-L-alanyl-D-glutamate--2,6-diaminopimelate ligase